jgi:hypothetical protein
MMTCTEEKASKLVEDSTVIASQVMEILSVDMQLR